MSVRVTGRVTAVFTEESRFNEALSVVGQLPDLVLVSSDLATLTMQIDLDSTTE